MLKSTHLKVLKIIEDNPDISQRELAKELGVSLGKTNYCLKALLQKGLIKAENFKNNKNKQAYFYLLTPEVFDYHPGPKFLMVEKDLFPQLAKEKKLAGYRFEGKWMDCGTFERYEKAIKTWK